MWWWQPCHRLPSPQEEGAEFYPAVDQTSPEAARHRRGSRSGKNRPPEGPRRRPTPVSGSPCAGYFHWMGKAAPTAGERDREQGKPRATEAQKLLGERLG